jgi:transposase
LAGNERARAWQQFISVVESCRRLKIPIRDYLCSILPGLANFPVNRIAQLTPASWLTQH